MESTRPEQTELEAADSTTTPVEAPQAPQSSVEAHLKFVVDNVEAVLKERTTPLAAERVPARPNSSWEL